jgi:hypothetical protein
MQELLNVKAAGTYSDHSALKGWKSSNWRRFTYSGTKIAHTKRPRTGYKIWDGTYHGKCHLENHDKGKIWLTGGWI